MKICIFTRKNKIILFFTIVTLLFACKDNKFIVENDYNELVIYLNKSRDDIINCGISKPVMFIYLREDNFIELHKIFNSNRLDYFIAIIESNETEKIKYYDKHFKHWSIFFKYDQQLAFIDCIDTFDYFLFDRIDKKYPNLKFPINYIKEYKMTYHQFNNRKYIQNKEY